MHLGRTSGSSATELSLTLLCVFAEIMCLRKFGSQEITLPFLWVRTAWKILSPDFSRLLSTLVAVAGIGFALCTTQAQTTGQSPQLAITFDDLPAHGPLPPGETRIEVASKILKAMHDAKLPPIYGFVNGVAITKNPADAAVLDAWRAVGNPLGNHGWSHLNLNQTSLSDFEQD